MSFQPSPTIYAGPERRRLQRSPMADVLHKAPVLELVQPEAIPDQTSIESALTANVREACLSALAEPHRRMTGVLALLSRHLPKDAPLPWQDVRFMIDTGQPANGETHDYFFRIRRSSNDHPLTFIRGLFHGLDRLMVEMKEGPTSLPPQSIEEIGSALGRTIAAALGSWDRRPQPSLSAGAGSEIRDDYAKWRWIRGHHIFAVLTQALIFCGRAIDDSARKKQIDALNDAADLFRALLSASARSMELTGDLSPRSYVSDIRPSMETPYLPSGFSGMLSVDHLRFVSNFRSLRPALDYLRTTSPRSHAALLASLSDVYDSHKAVCAKFIGTDRSSLLMASECQRSAVEQIDRFKQMRLRVLQ